MPRHIKHSVLPVWSAKFRIFSPVYWMTQHLHLGFFLMVTCSACCGSCGKERCTSTWPGRASTTAAPFFVPFIALGVLCCTRIATFVCGEEGALVCKFHKDPYLHIVIKLKLFGNLIKIPIFAKIFALTLRLFTWAFSSSSAASCGAAVGVGVMGLPPFISDTISSASRLRSPSGRNGLSHPLSVLKFVRTMRKTLIKHHNINCKNNFFESATHSNGNILLIINLCVVS